MEINTIIVMKERCSIHFKSDGKMAVNTSIDDKVIGSDGIAVSNVAIKIEQIKICRYSLRMGRKQSEWMGLQWFYAVGT